MGADRLANRSRRERLIIYTAVSVLVGLSDLCRLVLASVSESVVSDSFSNVLTPSSDVTRFLICSTLTLLIFSNDSSGTFSTSRSLFHLRD